MGTPRGIHVGVPKHTFARTPRCHTQRWAQTPVRVTPSNGQYNVAMAHEKTCTGLGRVLFWSGSTNMGIERLHFEHSHSPGRSRYLRANDKLNRS